MTELTMTRTVHADRERVWHAWTDATELARWFWPPNFDTMYTVDVRPGGSWRIASEVAGIAVSGVFTAVEPIERLVFTWRWDGEAEQTTVSATFADADAGGTAISITHDGFDTATAATEHEQGWNDCLDRLFAPK